MDFLDKNKKYLMIITLLILIGSAGGRSDYSSSMNQIVQEGKVKNGIIFLTH